MVASIGNGLDWKSSMLSGQQQAQYLRTVLVPYIQKNGVEQDVEYGDGTRHRYRQARLGGFVLCYETPFHRNRRQIASYPDEALNLQASPIEDYVLTVHFHRTSDDPATCNWVRLYNACWHAKGAAIRVTDCASNTSHWYDILLVALELAANAAQCQIDAVRPQRRQTTQTSPSAAAVGTFLDDQPRGRIS
jgi:hypothetical protein